MRPSRWVLVFLFAWILGAVGAGCAGSDDPSDLDTVEQAAAIVCTHEDPCAKGYVCRGGKCIKTCHNDADCPAGQTCNSHLCTQ